VRTFFETVHIHIDHMRVLYRILNFVLFCQNRVILKTARKGRLYEETADLNCRREPRALSEKCLSFVRAIIATHSWRILPRPSCVAHRPKFVYIISFSSERSIH